MSTQEASRPQTGTDPVSDLLQQRGLPVTRENWIKLAWLGQPPMPWTPENEQELPASLQQQDSESASLRSNQDLVKWAMKAYPGLTEDEALKIIQDS